MSGVTTFLVVADDADIRLDRWFRSRYPGLSHGRLEKLLRTGQIRVDGRRAKASLRLAAGNQVRVPPLSIEMAAPEKGRSRTPAPSEADFAAAQDWVLYRDDMMLAINKPAGLAVQGGSGVTRHVDALLDGLRFGSEERPRLVHRLDKDTSGVLLLARSAAAARHLTKWFRDQELRKIYWALTIGRPDPERGRIDAAIAKKITSTGVERVIPAPGEAVWLGWRSHRELGAPINCAYIARKFCTARFLATKNILPNQIRLRQTALAQASISMLAC
jgi:23S rRNA pseudouridine955/2504/2580 synthase